MVPSGPRRLHSREIVMSNTRVAPYRSAEDRAWDALYRSVNDPSTAAEVVELFDADPDVRKAHLALYLRCRQTVRAMELRRMRIERVAAFLQMAFFFVIARPFVGMIRLFRGGTDVAIEMMPKGQRLVSGSNKKSEPAGRRARKLKDNPEVAQVVQELQSAAPVPATSAGAALPVDDQAFATVSKAKADL